MALDRTNYLKMKPAELERRLARAKDRVTRAPTTEAYLADEFTIQEIEAAQRQQAEEALLDNFNYVGSRHHY